MQGTYMISEDLARICSLYKSTCYSIRNNQLFCTFVPRNNSAGESVGTTKIPSELPDDLTLVRIGEPHDRARICVFERLTLAGFPLFNIENR